MHMLSPTTTKLVISVRSPAEATVAMSAGADVIDVKEPSRGSLGAAEPETLSAVIRCVHGRVPVSAALGELLDATTSDTGELSAPFVPSELIFAKFGLAGCGKLVDWQQRWEQALERFPQGVDVVGVVYADWQAALAPSPPQVIAAASQIGCRVILVDTYVKDGRSLLDHWTIREVRAHVQACHEHGLQAALAGSLRADTLRQLLPLAPDYVAFRGAACDGHRDGLLSAAKVRRLSEVISQAASPLS
jgi:uncharacterized protein (UPF0264 family)